MDIEGIVIHFEVSGHFQLITHPHGILDNTSSVSIKVHSVQSLLEFKRKIFKVVMIPPYLQNFVPSGDPRKKKRYHILTRGEPLERDEEMNDVTTIFDLCENADIVTKILGDVEKVEFLGVLPDKSIIQLQIENFYKNDPEISDFMSNFSFRKNREEITLKIDSNDYINRLIGAEERGPLLLIFQFLSPLYMIRSLMFVNKSFNTVTRKILSFTSSSATWNNEKHLPLLCGSLCYVNEEFLKNLIFNFPNCFREGIERVRINYFGLSITLPEYCIYRRFFSLFFELITNFEWPRNHYFDFFFLRTVIHSGNEKIIEYVLNNFEIDLIQAPNGSRDERNHGFSFDGERIVYDYLLQHNRFDLIERELLRIEGMKKNKAGPGSSSKSTVDEVVNYMNIIVSYIAQNLDTYSISIPFSKINSLHEISGVNTSYVLEYVLQFMGVLDWRFLEGFMTIRLIYRLYVGSDIVETGDYGYHRSLVDTIKKRFVPQIREKRFEEFGKFICKLFTQQTMSLKLTTNDDQDDGKKQPPWILDAVYGPRIMLEYYGYIGDIEGIQRVLKMYDESQDFNRLSYHRERDRALKNNFYVFYSEWEKKKAPLLLRFMFERISAADRSEALKLLLPGFEIAIETMQIWLEELSETDIIKLPVFDLFIDLVKSESCWPPHEVFFSEMLFEIAGHCHEKNVPENRVFEIMDRVEDANAEVEWRLELLKISIEFGYDQVCKKIITQRMKLGMMKIIADDIFEFSVTNSVSRDVLENLFRSVISQKFDVPGFESGRLDFLVRVFRHAYVYNNPDLFEILRSDKGWDKIVVLYSLYSQLTREDQEPVIKFLKDNVISFEDGRKEYSYECEGGCGKKIRIFDEEILHGRDYFIRKNVKGVDFFSNFLSDSDESSDVSDDDDEEEGEEKEPKDDIFVVCKNCK